MPILRINQMVLANFCDQGEWIPGEIKTVNHTPFGVTYDVEFVNKERETSVPPERIRVDSLSSSNASNHVRRLLIQLPQSKLVKYLPSLAAKRIPPRSQAIYHVPSVSPGKPNAASTFFYNREKALKAWKETLPSTLTSTRVLDPQFAILKQPPEKWFVVGGQKDEFSVRIGLRTKQEEKLRGKIDLKLTLAYENLMRVKNQNILNVLTSSSIDLANKGAKEMRFRIEEPSRVHDNQRFVLIVSCPNRVRGERIISVTTNPILVLSKSVTLVKQELERRGLYSSKQSHAGDGLRFRYSGRDRLTSTIDREITPYVFYFDLFVGSNSFNSLSNKLSFKNSL
jgi:hypothetical protein